jgi:uncharacterized protein
MATGPMTLTQQDRSAVDAVGRILMGKAPLGVAISGGVDSGLLLALSAHHLGADQVTALLGVSVSLAGDERRTAHEVAAHVGVRVVEVLTREAEDPEYVANRPDRCFHCRDELFRRIDDEIVAQEGLTAVAYGENADDALRPDRPGAAAAARHGVLSPLRDAGIEKAQVRRLASWFGLPNAERPAAPCLASRIPYFEPVLPHKLRQIEQAEEALRAMGLTELRVRHHGSVGRVELPADQGARVEREGLEGAINRAMAAAGFAGVVIDAAGIRSGAFFRQATDAADD